jgi:outer membrane protein assembly factor BamB
MKAAFRFVQGVSLAFLSLATMLCSCTAREQQGKNAAQGTSVVETTGDVKDSDPRAAFETSCLVGGLSASLENSVTLIAASGRSESGVALAIGGALSTAVVARSAGSSRNAGGGQGHELVLASGARTSIPGPALAIVASGDRIVASCADPLSSAGGALICFRTEGEGERLVASWKRELHAANHLLAVPGGRVIASEDSSLASFARIYCFDSLTGKEIWSAAVQTVATDIAYAPGIALAVTGAKLIAFDESTGVQLWSAALTAKARSLSAGNGVALVLAETGSLSAFSLGDGKGIGAAPGPFDSSIRPVADGGRALVTLVNGGAAEVEISSGQMLRSWTWEGPASFLIADRDRIYAGIDGLGGKGLYFASRAGESKGKLLRLASGAFSAPVAVSGTRGGLLILLMDGSLVLVGKDMEASDAPSALDTAIRPKAEIAQAISAALGRFKPVEAQDPRHYLRFDLFVQGMPVDAKVAFTAFAFDPPTSARRTFYAKPSVNGSVITVYSEEGREIAASIDELGATSSASAYIQKGKRYWIVAGWTYQAEIQNYRIFVR